MTAQRWRQLLTAVLVGALALSACSQGSGTSVPTVPGNPDVKVTLGLVRDQEALEASALNVNDPSSDRFGDVLSVREIAAKYGASDEDRDAVATFLSEHSDSVETHPTGLLVTATMPSQTAEELFDVTLVARSQGDATYLEVSGEPTLKGELVGRVQEVTGLTRTLESNSSTASTTAPTTAVSDQECTQAKDALAAVSDRYGISPLRAITDGAGVRVAVAGITAPDPQSLEVWGQCLDVEFPTTTTVSAKAAAEQTPGPEAVLDAAMLLGTAPGVESFTYLEFDPRGWVGDPYAAALAMDHTPDIVSTSVGYCELALDDDDVRLAEAVLAAAALTGTSVVAASGDMGSACNGGTDLGVQFPASSLFATAVGGTQWGSGDDAQSEVVWNTGLAATGGGYSRFIRRPSFQTGDNEHRRVPDIALLADPARLPPIPVCLQGVCDWQSVGGTSASAPLAAGAIALLKSSASNSGAHLGHLPLLLAASSADDRVVDIVSGSNALDGARCCDATLGPDAASGWGTPRFDRFTNSQPEGR